LHEILVRNAKGKRSVQRSECRQEDNIKMDIKERGVREWIEVKWLRIGPNGGLL
jgi:hypothetical protein